MNTIDIEVSNETELWVVHALIQGQRMTPESISKEIAHDIPREDIRQSLESLQSRGIVEHGNGWELSH